MATTANETEELARQSIRSLDNRDRDAFGATHAANAVLHHPQGTYRGIDEIIAFQWALFDAFPDLTFIVEDVVAGDERAATRYTVTGTHQGEFGTIPPTGTTVEMPVMALMRVDNGAVVEVWIHPDRLGLLQQLGAVEPRAQ